MQKKIDSSLEPIRNRLLFSLALKELRHQRSTVILFSISLAIGLFAFIAVESFKSAVQAKLEDQARSILGADIGIGSRQRISESSLRKVDSVLQDYFVAKSEMIETYTMLMTKGGSRLVELKGIDTNFPFYGKILLTGGEISAASGPGIPAASTLFYPETLVQLGLQKGDDIQLGGNRFRVGDSILSDPAAIGTGFNFAPTVYVGLADLKSSNLIQTGSTGYFSFLYKLKEGAPLDNLEKELQRALPDASIRVLTPQGTSQQVSRLTRYLSDYLALASLVALLLAAFGCGYLYESYLKKNSKTIATYKILGLKNKEVRFLFLFHTFILSLLGLTIALLVSLFALPALSNFGALLLNMDVEVGLSIRTALFAGGISLVGSFLINSPLVRHLDKVSPKSLLQQQNLLTRLSWKDVFAYLPVIAAFLVGAYFLSESMQASSYFLAGISLAALVLFAAALVVALLFRHLSDLKGFHKQWITKSIYRNIRDFNFAYFCMSIGIILIVLIPMIEEGIQNEIRSPDSANTPSFFLFDIQNDQLADLQSFLNNESIQVQSSSPMIRARLQTVNDKPFERFMGEAVTREQEQENRSRNRGYNLTYRLKLRDTENLMDGQFWSAEANEDQVPQISVETRFAERLGLNIGDRLIFDVEGVPVEGRVSSLRKVKWTSFQPNFFLQFQPHPLLKELPQTHVMAVKAPSAAAIPVLQNQLANRFPSISVIDIVRLAENLSKIIDQLSSALKLVGLTSVIVGLLIFFSMINQRAVEKRKQANLLRVLGASRSTVYFATLGEFVVLILLAIGSGVFLSYLLNAALLHFIFDALPTVRLDTILMVCLIVFAVSSAVAYFAVRRALVANPNELLKESQ